MSEKISVGKIPKILATKKPTKPEYHLLILPQNLYKNSDIIHSAIETPNRSRFIHIFVPKNQLKIEKTKTIET